MRKTIHQFLPSLAFGDAISDEAVAIRDALIKRGCNSEIYAQYVDPRVKTKAHFYADYQGNPGHTVIFHSSIRSDVGNYVKKLPDTKILIYHNLTPGHFFKPYSTSLCVSLIFARTEVESFVNKVVMAYGDSEYNRLELQDMGFTNTGVFPIFVDFAKYERTRPNQTLMRRFGSDGWVNILFVGRIAPNKKPEDVVKAFYFYKKYINPKSRLFIVGGYETMQQYKDDIDKLIQDLKLDDVHFTGKVSFEDLVTYYTLATVFVSMSEHEGFCVPLAESMYFNVPIIAYKSTSIPYMLGSDGMMFTEKKYEEVAELLDLIVRDTQLREKIIESQKRIFLKYYGADVTDALLDSLLEYC